MTKDTRDMTVEEAAALGITIVEAVGSADNGGRELSRRIEGAMGDAVRQVMAMGIADDTPSHRVAEILGVKDDGRIGADIIRAAKQEARVLTKSAFLREGGERRAAIEAKARGEG